MQSSLIRPPKGKSHAIDGSAKDNKELQITKGCDQSMDGPRAYTTIQRLEETDTGKGDNGLWNCGSMRNEQRERDKKRGDEGGRESCAEKESSIVAGTKKNIDGVYGWVGMG